MTQALDLLQENPYVLPYHNGQKYLWNDGGVQSQFLSPCPKQIRQRVDGNSCPGRTPRKANHHPNTGRTSMTFCVQVKIRVNLLKPDLMSPGSFSYWYQIPDNLQHSCNCIDTDCLLWLSIFLCALPKSQNVPPQDLSSLGLQELSIMKL